MKEADNLVETTIYPQIYQYLSTIEQWKRENNPAIDKLESMGNFDRILDIGCGTGGCTMALLFRLRPREIVGIDKEKQIIDGVNLHIVDQLLIPLKKLIQKMKEIYFDNKDIFIQLSRKNREIIKNIIEEYGNLPLPTFLHEDITFKKENIEEGKYNLIVSRYSLYHIFCEDLRNNQSELSNAMSRIANKLKMDGLFVAYEPNNCPGIENAQERIQMIFDEEKHLQFVEKSCFPNDDVYIYKRK